MQKTSMMSQDTYTQLLHQLSPHLSQHLVILLKLLSVQSAQKSSVNRLNYRVDHWYALSVAVSGYSLARSWTVPACCHSHHLSSTSIKKPNTVILGLFERFAAVPAINHSARHFRHTSHNTNQSS